MRRTEELSDRERQVLDQIVKGLKNREIAKKLKITERTVKFHTANIFEKLEVDSRSKVIVAVCRARHGLKPLRDPKPPKPVSKGRSKAPVRRKRSRQANLRLVWKLIVLEGRSNAEIARMTGLPSRTVKFYVSNFLDEYGCEDREKMIAMYWQKLFRPADLKS